MFTQTHSPLLMPGADRSYWDLESVHRGCDAVCGAAASLHSMCFTSWSPRPLGPAISP